MQSMNLKSFRKHIGLTQAEAATVTGVPLRSYVRYENDKKYVNSLIYNKIMDILLEKYCFTETKGLHTIESIKDVVSKVLVDYKIDFCYLFGSYAKGYATEESDVDLCISGDVSGLAFYGLVEKLRQNLCKKVDLIRFSELTNNSELLKEIMKDGIKIYG